MCAMGGPRRGAAEEDLGGMTYSLTTYVVAYGLMGCNIAFLFIDLARVQAVRGTQRRYVCATIQWALAPPAFVFPALMIVAGRHVIGSLGFLQAVWVLYDLCRSDDDNWWRRKRKQLRKRLAVMRLQPSSAGTRP